MKIEGILKTNRTDQDMQTTKENSAPSDSGRNPLSSARNNTAYKLGGRQKTSADRLDLYSRSPYSQYAGGKNTRSSRTKLGGPNTTGANKMHNCPREVRDKVFNPENVKAYVGRGVPGPAEYNTDRIILVDSNRSAGVKHTIPRARRDVGFVQAKADRTVHYGVAHLKN